MDIFKHEVTDQKLEQIFQQQEVMLCLLRKILGEEHDMSTQIQAIVTQAAANLNLEQSALDLLTKLFTQLQATANGLTSLSAADQATLTTTIAQMQASAAALAAGIVADTPADATAATAAAVAATTPAAVAAAKAVVAANVISGTPTGTGA